MLPSMYLFIYYTSGLYIGVHRDTNRTSIDENQDSKQDVTEGMALPEEL